MARALNSNVAIKTSKYMNRLKLNHHLCHLIGNGGPTGPVSLSIFWSVSHPTLFPSCSLATRAEKIQNISHSVCLFEFRLHKKIMQVEDAYPTANDGFQIEFLRWGGGRNFANNASSSSSSSSPSSRAPENVVILLHGWK